MSGRHWPPEPVAKAGLTGGDGAGIGASAFGLETRPGLQLGWMCPPAAEGQDARSGGRAKRDVTWSGVTARTEEARPAFLNTLGWWGCGKKRVCFFTSSTESAHYGCPLGSQNPQHERNGATQLKPGPLNPDTKPSSLEMDMLHFTTTALLDSGIGSGR